MDPNPITHFSHEHPLFLLKQKPMEEVNICYACEVQLIEEKEHLEEVYGCEFCEKFFLHKHCAELPMEIVHKLHENHSLFLVLKPHFDYNYERCQCQPQCPSWRRRFFYYCFVCEFLLETKCAFREKSGIVWFKKGLIFHHPSHKHHPLMILSRPASLLCDGCGAQEEDLFCHCPSCHYGIHKHCAMLPITTTHNIHSHPLTLSFIGLPLHHRKFQSFCDVCEGLLSRVNYEIWLYYCDWCRYFVHVRCMDETKRQIEPDYEGLVIEDLIHLPMIHNSVKLIRRFLPLNNNLADNQPEISIFSHKHALIYSNGEFIEDENEDGEDILCDACIEPIMTPPYYRCAECRYFLHLACAKLGEKLEHPSHPHLLILTSKTRFDEVFKCDCCKRTSNGFFFHCAIEGCEFNLDLKCAALPKAIKYASHNHILFQMCCEPERFARCRGCITDLWGETVFGCKYCDFYLDIKCVLRPERIRHRFDSKHPLILRFPPHAYHPKPFDCYQCEVEIDPNKWLYHCEKCDLSFHISCVDSAWKNSDSTR